MQANSRAAETNIWFISTEATGQWFGKDCLGKNCCFRPPSLYKLYCYPPICQYVIMEKATIKAYFVETAI